MQSRKARLAVGTIAAALMLGAASPAFAGDGGDGGSGGLVGGDGGDGGSDSSVSFDSRITQLAFTGDATSGDAIAVSSDGGTAFAFSGARSGDIEQNASSGGGFGS